MKECLFNTFRRHFGDRALTIGVLASRFVAMWQQTLKSPEQTYRLGESIGAHAMPGLVVALVGDLGAGKTCLAQGIARGLDIHAPVTSPTFVLVSAYPEARIPFFHADFYRLGDSSELQELGLDESLGSGSVCVVEWADMYPEYLPADHLRLVLTDQGQDCRGLVATAHGAIAQGLLEAIQSD
ncbi:MAG: tRNA (adenosine(37)-N6)-threonylcarbamoyltransferase complex ATPase subunit type 1 TsaE [Myxococcota bacterium]|nr:tRNA (adenosine(37)-N6)-threonylcarbamoyltransferase complex ATPase subunit type 1 TsaE [Myxococcota bacterium]